MSGNITISQPNTTGCQAQTLEVKWEGTPDPLGVKYAALQAKVREYLSYGSIDGKAERQILRKELAELVK